MSLLPSTIPIQHIYWEWTVDDDNNPVLDGHGNPIGGYGPPIQETCSNWWPLERRTWSQDPIDPNLVGSYENDIHLLVDDATLFTKPDRVVVNGDMYQVEGLSTDWPSGMPYQSTGYGALIGGEVHCRRVTDTAVLGGM